MSTELLETLVAQLRSGNTPNYPHISEITEIGEDKTSGCRGLIATKTLPKNAIVAFEEIKLTAEAFETPGISVCWGLVAMILKNKDKEGMTHLIEDLAENPKLLAKTLSSDADMKTLIQLQKGMACDLGYLKQLLSKVLANFLIVTRAYQKAGHIHVKQHAAIPNVYRMMNHHSELNNIVVASPADHLYYLTTRAVKAGDPLLIDYGCEYANLL